MKRSLLLSLIDECVSRGDYDFIKDCIIKNINRLKIYGYAYKGYVANINSIQSYFKHNLALLRPEIWHDLFKKSGVIYTKVKDTAPTKYMESADVDNSLVANECIIEGTVQNSVLFRGVRVHKNAVLKNCIILEKCVIEENVKLENVILDKFVHVSKGKKLIGTMNYPVVIEKKAAI
jgi:glucose-1-phosphate adenylyltransferase